MRSVIFAVLALLLPGGVQAQQAPRPAPAVADAPADPAYPAQLRQVRYPTGGVEVPARYFVASGEGPHPTVLLLHGFPGTELNLDLARAIQRAGWNVLAIHYRGVWGAPGQFGFGHVIEDTRATLQWLRAADRRPEVDASRIVVLGHSMGGFATVMVADDLQIAGFVALSAWDISTESASFADPALRPAAEAALAEDVSFTNMNLSAMTDEMLAHAEAWDWTRNGARMAGRPVLVVDSNDGLAPRGEVLVQAVTQAGGPAPTRIRFDTDHSYNDHRIALSTAVTDWLRDSFPRSAHPGDGGQ